MKDEAHNTHVDADCDCTSRRVLVYLAQIPMAHTKQYSDTPQWFQGTLSRAVAGLLGLPTFSVNFPSWLLSSGPSISGGANYDASCQDSLNI